jgi:hypothetical protein
MVLPHSICCSNGRLEAETIKAIVDLTALVVIVHIFVQMDRKIDAGILRIIVRIV